MTQEELDALMKGDLDDMQDESSEASFEEDTQREITEPIADIDITDGEDVLVPFPATNENRMVHQLDDVTKESEEKATEIFDIIDGVSATLMDKEENLNKVLEVLNANVELFSKLSTKFPDIEIFKTSLETNKNSIDELNDVIEALQTSGDDIMNVMDIMQYQDIHRQKIERVINVMRALSKYMNKLFEGKIEDEKRVSSAKHIAGDTHNDVASTDDIEALLEQFGQK
jgi:chemotaxis regulatin CheY-phosphate phosphatase CheZ